MEATHLNRMLTTGESLDMVPVPGCRFAEARTERLPCPVWSAEESTGPTQDAPIVWGPSGASGSGLPCWTPKGLPLSAALAWS